MKLFPSLLPLGELSSLSVFGLSTFPPFSTTTNFKTSSGKVFGPNLFMSPVVRNSITEPISHRCLGLLQVNRSTRQNLRGSLWR